jgi:hypothetical protein
MDYKRCQKKWYWKWRKGLTPRHWNVGPLEFGTWVHEAFERWYGKPGLHRVGDLADHFSVIAHASIATAQRDDTVPERRIEKAFELLSLGEYMLDGYSRHYNRDEDVIVIQPEMPLEFTISNHSGQTIAVHRLKPDLVFEDVTDGDVWLMENKTAATVRTGHLRLDDQARPYGAMTAFALTKLGVLKGRRFKGIQYNFLRKALPDEREKNKEGKYLNQNGTVSKRQPPAYFVRYPVRMSTREKVLTLQRVQRETIEITDVATGLRAGSIPPSTLHKTPHGSCERTCQFFDMCVAEESGSDIRSMEKSMYVRQDPYTYGESTDEPAGFEMG